MKWFIVSWCNEGLETVVPASDIEAQMTWEMLGGEKAEGNLNFIVNMMILRARANTQRFYEIYAVQASEGITKEDIEEMFENSPQMAADTIRRLGQKMYSDRAEPGRIKIT